MSNTGTRIIPINSKVIQQNRDYIFVLLNRCNNYLTTMFVFITDKYYGVLSHTRTSNQSSKKFLLPYNLLQSSMSDFLQFYLLLRCFVVCNMSHFLQIIITYYVPSNTLWFLNFTRFICSFQNDFTRNFIYLRWILPTTIPGSITAHFLVFVD